MWRRVLPYLTKYRRRLVIGLVALVLCRVFHLIVPQVLERAVDALEAGATGEMWTYGGFIVAAAAGSAVFRFFMRWYLIGISRYAEYDLRRDFYAQLQRLPAAFYARYRVGDILSRGAQDMNAVRMVLGPGVMYPVETVITTVGCFGFMLAISPRLTLVALAVMPMVSILMKILGAKIFRRSEVVQAKMADISAVVQENAAASRLVRAFVQEDAQRKVFGKENEAYATLNMRLVAVSAALFPLLLAFVGMGLAGSLVLGGRLVIGETITLGQLVAFLFYYGYLTWPMIAIGWVVNIHQRGAASMKRLAVIFDADPLAAPPAGDAGIDFRRAPPPPSSSGTSGSPTPPGGWQARRVRTGKRRRRSSRTSTCAWNPARPWRSWGAPAAARARWPGSFRGSTTPRKARSGLTDATCGKSRSTNCGATSVSSHRTASCSP